MRLDQEKLDILQKIKADKLFPSLLTSDEKKKIKTKRKVKKVTTTKKVADDTHSADVPSTKEILSSLPLIPKRERCESWLILAPSPKLKTSTTTVIES